MKLQRPTPNSRLEVLVTMLSLAAILIPIRIISKEVLSDNWIGSLGILTIVITLLIVLSYKGKLGWYGEMFIRQLTKMHKGKRKYLFITQSLFLISFGLFTIYAVHTGNTVYGDLKDEIIAEFRAEGIPIGEDGAMDAAMEMTSDIPIEDQLEAMISLPVIAVKEFQIIAVSMAISNDLMDGWLMYIWQIVVVESIEFMGVFIVTKKYVKTKSETTT